MFSIPLSIWKPSLHVLTEASALPVPILRSLEEYHRCLSSLVYTLYFVFHVERPVFGWPKAEEYNNLVFVQ